MSLDINPEGKKRRHLDVARSGRPAHESHVSAQCQHEKNSGKHILSLGDPRHRFHPQWMNGPCRRYERATPERACHLEKHEKQQNHRRCMQEDVGEMMSCQAAGNTIENWQSSMCVSHVTGCQWPIPPKVNDQITTARGQSPLDHGVAGYIDGIVINEPVMNRFPKNDEDQCHQAGHQYPPSSSQVRSGWHFSI